jgi:hypothetical protein
MCGVMVSVLASIAVDSGFEPRSGQTKDLKNNSTEINSLVRIFYLQMQKVQGLAKDGNPYTVMNGRLLTKSYACMIKK